MNCTGMNTNLYYTTVLSTHFQSVCSILSLMPKPPITQVIDTMYAMYEEYPETELQYETPFQLLIAVIMSAQTTDKQVNVVTQKLYQVVKTPQDVLDLWQEQLWEYIRFVGLRKAKAKNIWKTSEMLAKSEGLKDTSKKPRTQFLASQDDDTIPWSLPPKQNFWESSQQMKTLCGYTIPSTLKWITELPWVWVKTAKVVLAVLYGQARIAVDTHVDRVSKRLWRIRGKVSADTTSKRLENKIPNEYKWKAHRSIIYFGRYHCTAKKPNCGNCPFKDWCPEGKRRLK